MGQSHRINRGRAVWRTGKIIGIAVSVLVSASVGYAQGGWDSQEAEATHAQEQDRIASSREDFERDLQDIFKSEPTPPAPDLVPPSGTVCIVHDVRPPDDWLALRSEPSTRYGSQLRRLSSGTEFIMLGERQGDWYRVRTMDGEVGWVSWATKRWIRC